MQFLHLCLKYEIGHINMESCWRVQLVGHSDRFKNKSQQLLQNLQQLHQMENIPSRFRCLCSYKWHFMYILSKICIADNIEQPSGISGQFKPKLLSPKHPSHLYPCSFSLLTHLQLAPFFFLLQQFSQKKEQAKHTSSPIKRKKIEKYIFFCIFFDILTSFSSLMQYLCSVILISY